MMKIRTLLIFSLVASAIFSCQKSEMEGDHNKGYSNGEIEYSMYANRPTKAEVLDNDNFKTFEIDSYKHEEDPANPGTLQPVAPYYKETVTKDATSGKWTSKMPRRWLTDPGKLDFYAYSDKGNVSDYDPATVATAPTFKYTVGAAADQQDLLVGSAIGRTESSNQGKLSLDFKHALTQIGLKAKSVSPAIKVQLKSVKFVGVNSVGKFSYDGAATVGAWSEQDTKADYTFTVETPAAVDNLTAVEQISADGNMMFIPAANPEEVEIQVTYDVYDANDDTKVIATGVNKTIKIKAEADAAGAAAATITPWNMGKKVTYTLILTAPANEIIFGETTLTDWDTETEIEYEGKDIFSMSTMFLSPINTGSIKVLVGDNRPTPGGFTIKSDGNWVKFSKTANDLAPTATLTHTPTVSRADAVAGVEIYVYSDPNLTGSKRTTKITLEREGYNSYDLVVEQQGVVEPFADVAEFTQADAYGAAYQVEGMVVPNLEGATTKLQASEDWFKLSLDGLGEGLAEITVEGNAANTPVDFYIHVSSDRVRSAKTGGSVTCETTDAKGGKHTFTPYSGISRKANTDYYAGRFAGEIKKETVGAEEHYYFDKLLFAAASDETGTYTWSTASIATTANDIFNGKANAVKLIGTTFPAANACNTKAPEGEFYLPAQNQLMGMTIVKSTLPGRATTEYWASTETSSELSWNMLFTNGLAHTDKTKYSVALNVRCAREVSF